VLNCAVFAFVLSCAGPAAAAHPAAAGPAAAEWASGDRDTLGQRDLQLRTDGGYWGASGPSTASPADSAARGTASRDTVFSDLPTPLWETVVLVPYYIIGIPFRILDFGIRKSAQGLADLGLFKPVDPVRRGLPGPVGTSWLPSFSIGDTRGTAIGINLFHDHFFGGDNRLQIKASTSTFRANRLSIGTEFGTWRPVFWQAGVGFDRNPGTRYYGIGPDSDPDDRSRYERTVQWAGANVGTRNVADYLIITRAVFTSIRADESQYDQGVPLAEIHAGDLPPGYGHASNGWNLGIYAERETTLETGRPGLGSRVGFGVDLFLASDRSRTRFWSLRAEAEKFFRLGHPRRTVAVRGFFTKLHNLRDQPLPFQRLVGNHRPDEFRGFGTYRFIDEGILGVNVEYRWPVWAVNEPDRLGIDSYLFTDVGQVFARYHQLALDRLAWSYGIGLRLIGGNRGFVARAEVGFSEERTIFRLKFSQDFQFAKKGLYHGKVPLPSW